MFLVSAMTQPVRRRRRHRGTLLAERAMEQATTYTEWLNFAREYDSLGNKDQWRTELECPDYDYQLIESRVRLLRKLRKQDDISRLVFYLREELHGNLGNIANPSLYMCARAGTKDLINDYLQEVVDALYYLCDTDMRALPPARKFEFFKRAAQSFGRSALLLSGGATLGLFHLGVIRELWEQNLLPRVISGSSAGALVAGVVGTHTDRELKAFFEPDNIDLEWSRMLGFEAIVKGRGILDAKHLSRTVSRNVKGLTFQQAFKRTNRIINISISPADPHQFPRLMNHLTAPNVYVRSAVLASTAIPGVFPAVQLKARNFEGKTVAYMPRSLWIDGSVHGDVPKDRVGRMHNVNHYIVSQANPHVVPFIRDEDPRKGVVPFIRQLMVSAPMVQVEHFLELARRHFDISPLGMMINKAHAIATQTYSGDVTIFPDRKLADLVKVFSNPTSEEIEAYILAGRRAVWPKIERIRNTTRISHAFDECLMRLRARYRYTKRPTARRTGSQARKKSPARPTDPSD